MQGEEQKEEETKEEEIEENYSNWQASKPIIASFSIVAGVPMPNDIPEVAESQVIDQYN